LRKKVIFYLAMAILSGCTSVSWNYQNDGNGMFAAQLKSSYPLEKADGYLMYKSALLANKLGYDYFLAPNITYFKDEKTVKTMLYMRKGTPPPGTHKPTEIIEWLRKHDYTIPKYANIHQGFWEGFRKELQAINGQNSQ
jgi:hypothetical protein